MLFFDKNSPLRLDATERFRHFSEPSRSIAGLLPGTCRVSAGVLPRERPPPTGKR